MNYTIPQKHQQTYFNNKRLVRCQFEWKKNRWQYIKSCDCDCAEDYIKLNPKDLELYEVHYCD